MSDPHESYLLNAGPLSTEPASSPKPSPEPSEALPTLAAILAELGTEGLQVGACSPVISEAHVDGTFRLFHWERPEVVLHLACDIATAVRQTAELLQAAAQLEHEAEEAEEAEQAEVLRGMRQDTARQDALGHLLFADDLGDFAESSVLSGMVRGSCRDDVLRRIDRIRVAVAAVPEEAWLGCASPAGPACQDARLQRQWCAAGVLCMTPPLTVIPDSNKEFVQGCAMCGGLGVIPREQGPFMVRTACPRCAGTGRDIPPTPNTES